MNQTKHLLVWLFALLVPLNVSAQDEQLDSIEISLLTCSPHEEIYSLYGHTALRVKDNRAGGQDIAVNYGMFSFNKPYFILRFIFGLTDYEMGIEPFDVFCRIYQSYGSSVTQQTFNLTREEKQAILLALEENNKPENRVYRYNYFYDNCTTRARDMVLNHLNGGLHYSPRGLHRDSTLTYRDMVHQKCHHHPWSMFGIDMLLGLQADFKTTRLQQEFLPQNLLVDLENTRRDFGNGTKMQRLVQPPQELVAPGTQVVEEDFPLRPRTVFLLLLALTVVITVIEAFSKKSLWWYDAILMLLCGLSGIVLTMMLFSQHPTVRVNLQILLLNPLPLFFIFRMIRSVRKKRRDWQFAMWIILICLFFVGGIWQQYAEGIYLMASSLLLRNIWCFMRQRTYATNDKR
ncbi:MAG: DUF4105 domain-containing protein [Prevotella sp.]|nr:DUF4105 domain-containing protein [Prevotella sp.]